MPRCTTEAELLALPEQGAIVDDRVSHPAVFPCEQAARFRPQQADLDTMNIFLLDAH